jgi:putative alpha-1,2-mannosidase
MTGLSAARFALLLPLWLIAPAAFAQAADDSPAAAVNPLIGSTNGGNTFPGPMLPFGMLQWSPETTRGKHNRTSAPGGYAYDHPRVRGFALTHLSGTGCAGASGDIPFMPITTAVTTSPSADATDSVYASGFSHADEIARAGYYKVAMANGSSIELTAALQAASPRSTSPPASRPTC